VSERMTKRDDTGRQLPPRYRLRSTYGLIHPDWTPLPARRRFGIESSYRSAGQVRGWTTSPNPACRFLLTRSVLYQGADNQKRLDQDPKTQLSESQHLRVRLDTTIRVMLI
jgi:hypothetical protein